MRRVRWVALPPALLVAWSCDRPREPEPVRFAAFQEEAFSGGGALTDAWADIDLDGDPDRFVGFNGTPSRLYRNDRIDGFNIRMRAFTLDGQVGSVWTVGKTSLMRTVPQLARDGDELLFAWTDQIEDVLEVVSVRMKIVDFYD